MSARRLFLLAGIAGGALIGALSVQGKAMAAASADMGSWGQAWGDDGTPEAPQPQRPRSPAPVAVQPVPDRALPATPMPT
ncbi:MAG TPA: hypothetical protein VK196_00335, partial [Magnetospirillum sp.]|nr:hypothetical protein [Magnetospirillum sp.]